MLASMPWGLQRIHDQGHTHFITFSCFERRPYLAHAAARDLVVDGLARTQKRYGLCIFGFVVMPEHVHVLLAEPAERSVAEVMKCWKLSVTLRQELRPFWEQRYHDFNVFTNEKRTEKLRYLHRNPVVRGLVEKPGEWRWSSFCSYSEKAACGLEIETGWTTA
jgi:putative transposase